MKKYQYHEGECVDHARIHAYENEQGTLKKCTVDDMGIDIPPFNTVIEKLNTAMNDLYFNIDDE